ncbi:hypothetical protein PSEUBRA_003933 [Kalmanozyma brasiliensis GHG001]|uniref:Uncharacterized protein n=1 Tax=Kalmanozyma brasiliensis (strain GHG001) TaxID=1365824 RepID=V5ELW9_KALBG|nr:uncharacterized protein PSEUBRA_003933 [Kalmanozyma brasiliensis GHG001]EST06075.1 hypothetical protein PSEUBRA_003933 [Kalmanozyma brasiliensis GHG001]
MADTENTSSNVAGSVSNSASSAYESVTSSAQGLLPKASSLIAEATGLAALQESYSDTPSQPQPAESSSSEPTQQDASSDDAPSKETHDVMARDDYTEENERGPSKSERPDQAQDKIGTEKGIPTTGGAGTTLSPDEDVQAAVKKNGGSKAAVGVDYSDQPCPTEDARRDEPTSKPAEGKTQFDDQEEKANGSSENSTGSSAQKSDSTAATSTDEGDGASEDAGSKVGFKDKLKGSAKVFAGKVTRNEDKVEAGKMLKAGGGAAGSS